LRIEVLKLGAAGCLEGAALMLPVPKIRMLWKLPFIGKRTRNITKFFLRRIGPLDLSAMGADIGVNVYNSSMHRIFGNKC